MEVKKFAEGLTVHGIGRILGTKSKCMKVIWLFCLLLFLSLLVAALMSTLQRYFSNLTLTKQATVIVPKMRFPSVTICGPSLSKHKLRDLAMAFNVSLGGNFEKTLDRLENEDRLSQVAPDEDKFFLRNLSQSGIGDRYLYPLETERILVLKRGYCYKVNPNGTFIQKEAGSDQALSAVFFLNVSDAISGSRTDTGDSIEIIVQDHREHPFLESGSVFAPVGFMTRVEISKKKIKRLKAPYPSKCTDGEDAKLVFKGKYTDVSCQQSCFLAEASKTCRALSFLYNLHLPKHLKKPFPKSNLESVCSDGMLQELVNTDFARCNCALPCSETKFHKSASYSKWPSTGDLPLYKSLFGDALGLDQGRMTDEFVRNNFLMINIFFGNMAYEEITEVPEYTIAKLASEIGGQMGVWIGASVFSIIELLFLLIQVSRHVFTSKKVKGDITIGNGKAEFTV